MEWNKSYQAEPTKWSLAIVVNKEVHPVWWLKRKIWKINQLGGCNLWKNLCLNYSKYQSSGDDEFRKKLSKNSSVKQIDMAKKFA